MSERDRVRLSQSVEEASLANTQAESVDSLQNDVSTVSSPAQSILSLQRTHGNQAVQRMLRIQRSTHENGGPLGSEISDEINSRRGQGSSLDSTVQAEAEANMGYDFSGVSVHNDDHSDRLNQELGAKAFTTGKDIFMSKDAANDKATMFHELTHVIHQDGSNPSGELTLGPADDAYEREADAMSASTMSAVTNGGADTAQAKFADVQREGMPEEEELQMKRADVQREGMPEEEELQMKRADVQRESMPEEEELQMKRADVQREGMPEEEELQMMRADVQREDMEEEEMMA